MIYAIKLMPNQDEKIQGKNLDKPLVFKGEDVKLQDFKMQRIPYPLERDEFYILTKSTSEVKDWQKRFFQIGIGVCLTIISKIVYFIYQFNRLHTADEKNKLEISISGWELVSLVLAFGTCLVLLGISQIKKSEKDNLILSLKDHFKKQN